MLLSYKFIFYIFMLYLINSRIKIISSLFYFIYFSNKWNKIQVFFFEIYGVNFWAVIIQISFRYLIKILCIMSKETYIYIRYLWRLIWIRLNLYKEYLIFARVIMICLWWLYFFIMETNYSLESWRTFYVEFGLTFTSTNQWLFNKHNLYKFI